MIEPFGSYQSSNMKMGMPAAEGICIGYRDDTSGSLAVRALVQWNIIC